MYIVLSYSKTFDNLHLENMKSTCCLCSLYFRVLTLRLFSPEGRLHLFIVVNGSEKNQVRSEETGEEGGEEGGDR